MHKRKKRRLRCVSQKKPFLTQIDAEKFIADNNSGPGLFLIGYRLERAYPCDKCTGWHVTSETLEDFERNKEKSIVGAVNE